MGGTSLDVRAGALGVGLSKRAGYREAFSVVGLGAGVGVCVAEGGGAFCVAEGVGAVVGGGRVGDGGVGEADRVGDGGRVSEGVRVVGSCVGLVRVGLVCVGLVRVGLVCVGLVCAGLVCAGLVWVGFCCVVWVVAGWPGCCGPDPPPCLMSSGSATATTTATAAPSAGTANRAIGCLVCAVWDRNSGPDNVGCVCSARTDSNLRRRPSTSSAVIVGHFLRAGRCWPGPFAGWQDRG